MYSYPKSNQESDDEDYSEYNMAQLDFEITETKTLLAVAEKEKQVGPVNAVLKAYDQVLKEAKVTQPHPNPNPDPYPNPDPNPKYSPTLTRKPSLAKSTWRSRPRTRRSRTTSPTTSARTASASSSTSCSATWPPRRSRRCPCPVRSRRPPRSCREPRLHACTSSAPTPWTRSTPSSRRRWRATTWW